MDIDRLLSNSLWRFTDQVLQPLQDWLVVHPFWNWLLLHPLWLLGLTVLLLFLFAGLLGAIARLTEAIWLAVLQTPIRLVQFLFTGVTRLLKLPFSPRLNSVSSTNQQERLTTLLNRLETLRQEQNELMQEIRSILAVTPSPTNNERS